MNGHTAIIPYFSLVGDYVSDKAHDSTSMEKTYLLHGMALIGVRGVLGLDNLHGSRFNVQCSLQIPNLTAAEVAEMFHWYERESSQAIDPIVIERIYTELSGQPGLTCWVGELLVRTACHEPCKCLICYCPEPAINKTKCLLDASES